MNDERRPARNAAANLTCSDFSAGVRESHGLEPVGAIVPDALLDWAADCDLAAARLRRIYRGLQAAREARAA